MKKLIVEDDRSLNNGIALSLNTCECVHLTAGERYRIGEPG